MTDAELRDLAVDELLGTTVGYTYFTKKGTTPGPKSRWGKALAYLDQIDQPPPPPPASKSALGVYVGGQNPTGVAEFGTWLGRQPTYALDWMGGDDWASITGQSWSPLPAWKGKGYTVVLGVPMFPQGGSLYNGAQGYYDANWTKLAQHIRATDVPVILRVGWEFGGGWYPWAVDSPAKADDYATYFRRIVARMREVIPGLRFLWNPIWGWQAVDPTLAYPGDEFVDYIGIDVYDQSWIPNYTDPAARWQDFMDAPYGGTFWALWKGPLCIPEWGLTIRADGHGGGDAPYFIERMADYIEANCAWHAYFEYDAPDGKHALRTNFPNGAAAFKRRFGA